MMEMGYLRPWHCQAGQVTFTVPDIAASSTPEISQKGGSSGTRVKDRVLSVAPSGVLASGMVDIKN